MKTRTGQSLSEYALICSLVVLVSIGGLVLLGKNISVALNDLMPKSKPTVQSTVPPDPATIGQIPGSPTNPASPPPPPPPSITTGGGNPPVDSTGLGLDLSQPTDVLQTVVTVGANGTTEILASSLDTLASTLLAEGKINPQGADAIRNLANHVHHMAEVEKMIETAAANSPDNATFMSTPLTIDGVTYNNGYEAGQTLLLNQGSTPGPLRDQLWQLNSAVSTEIWQADEATRNLISAHVAAVNDIGDTVSSSLRNVIDYNTGVISDLQKQEASTLSHGHGAIICQQGNSQDNGVVCTPQ